MSSRRRPLRRIAVMAVLLAIPSGVLLSYLALSYPDSPGPGTGREVILDIPWGESPSIIARRAADAGVVSNARTFAIYLRLSGHARRLKAGRHLVEDHWTPAALALALTKPGEAEQVRVTLPEGSTRFSIAEELEKRGIVSRDAFLEVCSARETLRRLEIIGGSAEGYLYPETYQMEPGTDPVAVVERLVETFDARSGPLFRKQRIALAKLGEDLLALERALEREGPLSDSSSPTVAGRHAAVILASMVEAETARSAERPQVAAVMLNRLLSSGFPSRKLQIDPTVRYGCLAEPDAAPTCRGWAGGLLATRHLEDEHNRFNTYILRGLPPGPIGSPSISSIEAVLLPTKTDALFFVADGDGGHVFSKTLEEHNKAVEAYRKRR